MDKENVFNIIADGIKKVTTAGTRLALASSSTLARRVIIQACPENTDGVVVGASTVVASFATRRGFLLQPGQSVTLNVKDLADIYVDSIVSGEGVSFVYFNN